jgi:hypothetical protein
MIPQVLAVLSQVRSQNLANLATAALTDRSALFPLSDCLYEEGFTMFSRIVVGQCFYIETFGKYWLGRVVEQTPTEVVLEPAFWIADTGRFHEFMTGESLETLTNLEIEPVRSMVIPSALISAFSHWPHALPRGPK